MILDPMALFMSNPMTTNVDSQSSYMTRSVGEGEADRFNEIFAETSKKAKAQMNEPDRSEKKERVGRLEKDAPEAESKEADAEQEQQEQEGVGLSMQYYLSKISIQENDAETKESDFISLVNRLDLLQKGAEGITELFATEGNESLKLDPSMLEGMAAVGLSARNEAVKVSDSGLKASLPILEHEIIEQVAQKLSLQKLNLNGKEGVTLELEPKGLGALKIEIAIHKGSVSADILTQYPIVKEILEKNLSLLHDGLMQSGLNIDQFSVNVGDFRNGSDREGNGEGFHFSDIQASDYYAEPALAVAGVTGRVGFFGDGRMSLYV